MKDKWAFIDESGDESLMLTVKDVSTFYVIGALIIDDEKYVDIESHFKGVKGRHFPDAEMKSSLVSNPKRRQAVLSDIVDADFRLLIQIIDKSKLFGEGFKYPPVFIKNLHNQLYHRIIEDFHTVHLRADAIKSQKLMDEFKKYIVRENQPTLFNTYDLEFVESKKNVFIQVIDFICGTIRRCYDNKESADDKRVYMSYLSRRNVIFDIFPYAVQSSVYPILKNARADFDKIIENRAIEEAYRFKGEHFNSKEELVQEQLVFLDKLTTAYYLSNGTTWVQSYEFAEVYVEAFEKDASEHKIKSVIGKMRDNGILVASRRSGGYKLPSSESDLYEYLNAQNMTITPMLGRIKKMRDIVNRATNGNLDVLDKEEYKKIKVLMETLPTL